MRIRDERTRVATHTALNRRTSSGSYGGRRTRRAAVVAAADLVAEGGVGKVTGAAVAARAGITLRQFESMFDGEDACLLAAFDEGLARLSLQLSEEGSAHGALRVQRIYRGLMTLLRFLDNEPGWGRILLIEPLDAVTARRGRALGALARVISDSEFGSPNDVDPPPTRTVAMDVVIQVLSGIRQRMLHPDQPLISLAPAMMSSVIEPQLGRLPGDGFERFRARGF